MASLREARRLMKGWEVVILLGLMLVLVCGSEAVKISLDSAPPTPPPTSPSGLFQLIPGRYPDTLSLPEFLQTVGQGPDGPEVIKFFLEFMATHLGLQIPPSQLPSILNDTLSLLNYLDLTALQLHESANSLNFAYQMGLIPQAGPSSPGYVVPPGIDLLQTNLETLPGFNLSQFQKTLIPLPLNSSSGLELPILLGWQSNTTTSEDYLTQSIILSLVLNQLSNNYNLTSATSTAELYSISANGNNFTDPYEFVEYLVQETNHTLSSYYVCRVADFVPLWYNSSGNLVQVPFPLMVRSQIVDPATQEEAVVPAVHCALIFHIEGSVFNTDISWYEGVTGIGFFPWNLEATPAWLGNYQSANAPASFTGTETLSQLRYATVLQTTLILASKMFNLYLFGYGATGVCLDSVATVLNSANSSIVEFYPLLMEKDLVLSALDNLAQRAASSFFPQIVSLIGDLTVAVGSLPSDYLPTGSKADQARRLYDLIPWADGAEPFQCVVDAKTILSNCISEGSSC